MRPTTEGRNQEAPVVSALLVTAASVERTVPLRLGPVSPEAYRAFLATRTGADGPSFLQVPAWARPPRSGSRGTRGTPRGTRD
ncbi:hypothetical protein EF906_18085, partial [Streptomyces sp. WAC08241]